MPDQRKSQRTGWNLLLGIHLGAYLIIWFLALNGLAHFDIDEFNTTYSHVITAALVWLPILAAHLLAYLYTGRRRQLAPGMAVERQAYRDGFADALRQLPDPTAAVERLGLYDEDELVELPKRKRRYD